MAGLIKRGNIYYALYYVGKRQKRVSLETESLQLAKEKLRQLESAQYRGYDNPFPTKTPIATIVGKYADHIKITKTAKSAQRDISYLRETFGPICPALALKNHKNSIKAKKLPSKTAHVYIEANYFEQVTTADIANFIAAQVRRKGIAPKTANRFREILTRLYNWATEQQGVQMPGGKNPAAQVERYRERAPIITFLTLDQISEQLQSMAHDQTLQTIIAFYIYSGLRREELCWLTTEDVDFSAGGNGMIRVRAKTINGEFWEPKTKVNRVVPISNALRTYLERYSPPPVKDNWYFSTPNGCRWDPDNLSGAIRDLNRKAGLDWTCLDFRHTFGSHLAMKGESLYKISSLMGNSPEICRKHYAALLPESLLTSVEFGNDRPPAIPPGAPATPALLGTTPIPVSAKHHLRLVVNNR